MRIPLPVGEFHYHYRFIATIALAEAARQIGLPAAALTKATARRRPRYHASLQSKPNEIGETVSAADPMGFERPRWDPSAAS